MKKLLLSLALLLPVVLLSSCSDDEEENNFNYPMEYLYGTWSISEVEYNGSYVDWEPIFEPTYITLNENGTYSSRGFFGSGNGTYTASGNTVITYIEGEEYFRYEVLSLTESSCEVIISMTGASETLQIKCVKN